MNNPPTPAAGDRPGTPEIDRAFAEWFHRAGSGNRSSPKLAWHAAVAWATRMAAKQVREVADIIRRQNAKHEWYGCNCEDVIDALAGEIHNSKTEE